MSEAQWGIRETPKDIDPEDYRVGKTLSAFMYRTIETEQGYLARIPVSQEELAKSVGVSQGLISQILKGKKHLTNRVLWSIARYLDVEPIAIKRPDPEQQRLPIAA